MKTSVHHIGISIVLLFLTAFLFHEVSLAQDQDVIPDQKQDKQTVVLTCNGLTLILMDTVRPTLGNSGKGLLHYDCKFIKQQGKLYLCKFDDEDKPVLVRSTLSDKELEILKHNLLFIDKQYQIQIKEWIREDKWDLNLGEAIKGFYMKPMFDD